MIKEKLQKEQIQALKSGEKNKLNTLRYILAQIQNKEIEKQAKLTDEEIILVLRKIAKDLKKSIEAFKKGKRLDLVEESNQQLNIVISYLPKENASLL